MIPVLALLALIAAWVVVLAWPTLVRRWRRRRQVTRLSEFVLEDVRSRMVDGAGTRSWR